MAELDWIYLGQSEDRWRFKERKLYSKQYKLLLCYVM